MYEIYKGMYRYDMDYVLYMYMYVHMKTVYSSCNMLFVPMTSSCL